MIKIVKSPEPNVLKNSGSKWLQKVVTKKAAGEPIRDIVYDKFRRNKEIKITVVKDSFGKCSYCESKILAVSHGDIDHIIPLDADHTLAFEWQNLVLSCTKCNFEKLAYFSKTDPLLNPLQDEPSEHLLSEDHWIRGIPNTKGPTTEIEVGLNRGGLIEDRQEHLENLKNAITYWKVLKAQNDPLMELAKRQILCAQERNKEYLFMKSNHVKNDCVELWMDTRS
ncbi:HNH endonuclease [bacterium]|nr:HNH endonuclease [bacterium]